MNYSAALEKFVGRHGKSLVQRYRDFRDLVAAYHHKRKPSFFDIISYAGGV
jgi:hypothetical protein